MAIYVRTRLYSAVETMFINNEIEGWTVSMIQRQPTLINSYDEYTINNIPEYY